MVDKGGPGSIWRFSLPYASLESFMPLAQEQLVVSRLPPAERCACYWCAWIDVDVMRVLLCVSKGGGAAFAGGKGWQAARIWSHSCRWQLEAAGGLRSAHSQRSGVEAVAGAGAQHTSMHHRGTHCIGACLLPPPGSPVPLFPRTMACMRVCRALLLAERVAKNEDDTPFDTSRLFDYSERVVWEGPATQLSPLIREPGKLAVTGTHIYFQPLHNITGEGGESAVGLEVGTVGLRVGRWLRPAGGGWLRLGSGSSSYECTCPAHTQAACGGGASLSCGCCRCAGDNPVRCHPLAAVAAVVRRRASLRPTGIELFFIHPSAMAAASGREGGGGTWPGMPAGGPTWDGPSAFFALR